LCRWGEVVGDVEEEGEDRKEVKGGRIKEKRG
jgi:hypothetical protein